jgi:hypothetical protein
MKARGHLDDEWPVSSTCTENDIKSPSKTLEFT